MKPLTLILQEKLTDHYKNYDKQDVSNLKYYSRSSRELNNYHWTKHFTPTHLDELENETNKMDKTISKNTLDKPTVLWSGIHYDPIKSKNALNIVHHPAYLSTSTNKKVATCFAAIHDDNCSHTLKIHAPQGLKAAYIGKNSLVNPKEKEVLLPRGLNLRYLKTTTDTSSMGTTRKFHHMEIV